MDKIYNKKLKQFELNPFNCQSAVPRQTLGHSLRGNLNKLMFILVL